MSLTAKDFFNAICKGKHDFTDGEIDRYYSPYVINRMLAQYRECVSIVNLLNTESKSLDKKMQFEYLLNTIPKKNRRMVRITKDKNDDVQIVSKWYNISQAKAEDYYRILPKELLAAMKKELEDGRA